MTRAEEGDLRNRSLNTTLDTGQLKVTTSKRDAKGTQAFHLEEMPWLQPEGMAEVQAAETGKHIPHAET